LKPFLKLFVLFALVNVGAVLAQDIPATDSLAIDTVEDTLSESAFPADTLNIDLFPADTLNVKPKKEPPFKSRIIYKAADSVKFDIQSHRAYMYGGTQINYDDIELKAYKTEFDMTSKIVYAKGGRDSLNRYLEAPEFKQGSNEFESDSMSYNFDTKKAVIHQIKTQQGEGFLQAVKAKRYEDGHIHMASGIYTTCDADCPHFGLRLTKGKIIPGDQVVFGPAYMELLGIPLYFLALPFGFFPQNDKQAVSGIIPPTIGMEISKGMNLRDGGYYFALNDHFDAKITGEIYSSGTWRTNLATRYMQRYKFTGDVNMSYGVTVSGEKGLDHSKQKQFLVRWSHRQDPKANPSQTFTASVDYGTTSYDREYNFDVASAVYNNTKNSSISYSKRWPNTPFNFNTGMQASQSSHDQKVTIQFPQFSFNMGSIYPFRKKESVGKSKWYEDIALKYDAQMRNTLQGHEDELFSDRNLKNMKNGFEHRIPFSINFKALKFFNITPSVNYTGVLYTSQIRKTFYPDSIGSNDKYGVLAIDTIRRLSFTHYLAPSLSISMTPKFFLTNTYGQNSRVEAIRTTISPTVSVSYIPEIKDMFNYHETYTDSVGKQITYFIYESQGAYRIPTARKKSGSVSLALNGNVEMKVRSGKDSAELSRKIKIIENASARTTYDMFRDSMKFGNIALSANTTILGMNLNLNGTVNPYKLTPTGTRINQFGPQLTHLSFATGLSLPLNKNDSKKDDNKGDKKDDYAYFDVPWKLSFNYGWTYSKDKFDKKIIQTLSFNGNVNFTKKWSFNYNGTYDFDAKKISQAQASIQRDLHCWEMSLSFSPFGVYKFYYFKINVKSGTLQDLKYEKRKSAGDFSRMSW